MTLCFLCFLSATCPPVNTKRNLDTTISNRTLSGTSLDIGCDPDYVQTGGSISSVTCQDNGQWTSFPVCAGQHRALIDPLRLEDSHIYAAKGRYLFHTSSSYTHLYMKRQYFSRYMIKFV